MAVLHLSEDVSSFSSPTDDVNALLGERHVPLAKQYNAAMHLGHMAAYREALRYAFGRRVLDVGCGSGYGAFFLASYSANSVDAIDVHKGALDYAQHVYAHPRLRFSCGSALNLPFPDESFDFVFSSQVIEHIMSSEVFLSEIKRVLKPQGFCMVTTPNQKLFSPVGDNLNPHHINEMDLDTYQAVSQSVFSRVAYRGIPQNCLELQEGSCVPVLKPDSCIQLQDYQVQYHDLQTCENLLFYGHKHAQGEFIASLPRGLWPVSETIAPLFFDPSIGAWVCLGAHPYGGQERELILLEEQGQVRSFTSPYAGLYRVEFDLAQPSTESVCLAISSRSGKRIYQKVFAAGARYFEAIFDVQADSEGRIYHVLLKPDIVAGSGQFAKDAVQMVGVKALKSTAGSGTEDEQVELLLRSYHKTLPEVHW